jgi:hypothetical protein
MRLEILPFGHMFRKGSAIRISVEAPTGFTGLWGFSFNPQQATNTIYADAERPSRLVLNVIPKLTAPIPLPACDTLRYEPCRAGTAPVPPGTEDPPLASPNQQSVPCRNGTARIVLPPAARRTRLSIRVDARTTKHTRRRGRLLYVRLGDARVAHRISLRFHINGRSKTREYVVGACST